MAFTLKKSAKQRQFEQAVNAMTKWPRGLLRQYVQRGVPAVLRDETLDDQFRWDILAILHTPSAKQKVLHDVG